MSNSSEPPSCGSTSTTTESSHRVPVTSRTSSSLEMSTGVTDIGIEGASELSVEKKLTVQPVLSSKASEVDQLHKTGEEKNAQSSSESQAVVSIPGSDRLHSHSTSKHDLTPSALNANQKSSHSHRSSHKSSSSDKKRHSKLALEDNNSKSATHARKDQELATNSAVLSADMKKQKKEKSGRSETQSNDRRHHSTTAVHGDHGEHLRHKDSQWKTPKTQPLVHGEEGVKRDDASHRKRVHSSSTKHSSNELVKSPTAMQVKRARMESLVEHRKNASVKSCEDESAKCMKSSEVKTKSGEGASASSEKGFQFPNSAHSDLLASRKLVFEPSGLVCTSKFVKEPESEEYAACSFSLNGLQIKFRVAKTTPTKNGQFVTLWKRIGSGPIMPFDAKDPVDLFVICVRDGDRFGHFVFPKNVLASEDIVSRGGKGGKRAIRVYAPWVKAESSQAMKTQSWQTKYFLSISDKTGSKLNMERVRKLYGSK